ncbi:PD-(D/E)XK nuclease family protein [Chitinibacter sp. GC72]|uniref:PD-(D/E)XK nuclease family protein n=1 Tax=Chitinibacter sp. GC72 TaxID=1526917 RepID=UPI0012F7E53C|nr:PD-(D/E)XK nuclease family protein [Chitinibacter sp. GC72]
MLDFNRQPKFNEHFSQLIDQALQAQQRKETPRNYLGGSRLGVYCERALQFEYAGAPVDPGREFSGGLLRVFAVGHALEDLAVHWLRLAGLALHTRRQNGQQFGFSVAGGRLRGHVDGVITDAPAELGWTFPMLWECKTMNHRSWNDTVKRKLALAKPVYAAQVAIYQAYMSAEIPGIAENPALFTAINKDTQEIYAELVPFDAALAQRMSDRAAKVLAATAAGELLPRVTSDPAHHECRQCAWQDRCWAAQH